MTYRCLSRNHRRGIEEFQFPGGGQVGNMQTGMIFPCQFHCQTRTLITSLLTTDFRMVNHLRIVAILFLRLRHIAVDDSRILAMGHNRQFRRGKDLFQSLTTIYQHITRGTTHKKFDAWDTVRIEFFKKRDIVVGSAKEETVIHVTLLCSQRELLFQGHKRSGLGHRVRHIEIGSHTTGRSRTTLGIDVGLLRQSRLTEMHMIVDDAWQYKTSRSINDFIR